MPDQQIAISQTWATIYVVIGIIISLVLPLAVSALKKASGLETLDGVQPTFWERVVAIWKKYHGSKYAGILLAAVVVALVIVFLLGLKFYTVRDAALAGFAWESLIKTLFSKRPTGP